MRKVFFLLFVAAAMLFCACTAKDGLAESAQEGDLIFGIGIEFVDADDRILKLVYNVPLARKGTPNEWISHREI